MKTLSYNEVLKLYYENIHESEWIGVNTYQLILLEHNVYIRYNHNKSLFLCVYQHHHDTSVYSIFGKHPHYKNEFFLYPANYNPLTSFDGKVLPLPETSDEWFNFSVMYEYTEEDFKLFKKIVQYHED